LPIAREAKDLKRFIDRTEFGTSCLPMTTELIFQMENTGEAVFIPKEGDCSVTLSEGRSIAGSRLLEGIS
jgi:hypothetical protein